MAKVMLVEDDNNLREIYEARLLAEGYEIVSAQDGEEALAMAVKEKPDLIIADIMMPKISGFDMLDILRSTPETKETKVIMMTALSQAEDKQRANKLGADRYLVKSQVTLEDVARVAHEVLEGLPPSDSSSPDTSGTPAPSTPAPTAGTPAPSVPATDSAVNSATVAPQPLATPPADTIAPTTTVSPQPVATQPADNSGVQVQSDAQSTTITINQPAADAPATPPSPVAPETASVQPQPQPAAAPAVDTNSMLSDAAVSVSGNSDQAEDAKTPDETVASRPVLDNPDGDSDDHKTSVHTKVIKPLNDLSLKGPSLDELLAKEEAKQVEAQPATAARENRIPNAATGHAVISEVKSGGKLGEDPNAGSGPPPEPVTPGSSSVNQPQTIKPNVDPNSIAL